MNGIAPKRARLKYINTIMNEWIILVRLENVCGVHMDGSLGNSLESRYDDSRDDERIVIRYAAIAMKPLKNPHSIDT